MTIKHKKSTIISDSSDKPVSDTKKHYVSNPELYENFVKWYAEIEQAERGGREPPNMPNSIGKAFLQIATNLAKKSNWENNYKYKDEMIGDALENCIKYSRNFNPNTTKNPFAYFTQVAFYAFLRRIKYEKKEDYVKHKTMLNSIIYQDMIDGNLEEEGVDIEHFDYNQEGIEHFIRDFEIKNFGEELAIDESAGVAGKRKYIKAEKDSQELLGFF